MKRNLEKVRDIPNVLSLGQSRRSFGRSHPTASSARIGWNGRRAPIFIGIELWDPCTIYRPSDWMEIALVGDIKDLRPKVPDSEKITINVGFVDLGRVDLMVREGFYSNRADFIRTAIRNQLERQDDAIRQSVARRQLKLGLSYFTRQELEAARDAGTPLQIQVLGLASIAGDVTPELARAAIASVQVLGVLHASAAVKAALASRIS